MAGWDRGLRIRSVDPISWPMFIERRRLVIAAAAVVAALGCGSGSHSIEGKWAGTGVLSGDVFTLTQIDEDVSGYVSGGLDGPIYGSNVSGNVKLEVETSPDYGYIVPLGPAFDFSGHFVNAVTVVGNFGNGPNSLLSLPRTGN